MSNRNSDAADSPPEKRLLFVVTEDWFVVSHFLGLARAARQAGYAVGIATRLGDHRAALAAEGFALFALEGNRGSLSGLAAFREIRAISAAITAFRPDVLHLVAMRPIALGGVIALVRRALPVVLAPTGLGFLFSASALRPRLARAGLVWLVRQLAKSGRAWLVFENGEDPRAFGLAGTGPRVSILGGAGVDGTKFRAMPVPQFAPIRFAVVARMLRSKGISTAVEGMLAARARGADAELHLYGGCDDGNPQSLARADLLAFAAKPGIFWHGHVTDIPAIWRDNHAALLLSDREGMPRALAEAAASTRPIIATDVPGCREIVRDGITGILVPKNDVDAAGAAILRLCADPALRMRMGAAGRALFESRFTLEATNSAALDVYSRLLAGIPHDG